MAVATRVVEQYGQRAASDAKEAVRLMGGVLGPIPRYLYPLLDDAQLADEIQKRWTARKLEMSQRGVMDQRLLRYMDPGQVQDHWQNMWTGAPLRKLQHSTNLSVGVFNWPRAIVEALTGLMIGGGSPLSYSIDVMPWDRTSLSGIAQSDIVEKFKDRWIYDTSYELRFAEQAANIFALGRNWTGMITDPNTKQVKPTNPWPGSIASFWQSDGRTLESVIVSTDMLPGEAVAMFPTKEREIASAVQTPASWTRSFGVTLPTDSWARNSTVTVLCCWYRTTKGTIAQAIVLMNAKKAGGLNTVLLYKNEDTGYPDIPYYCTPRFKTNDRPADEAQGVLFDIAPIATQYDEVVSAARDMLWRAIYQRYKLTNAYGRAPTVIPNTSIIALRAGQDLQRLDDVLNTVPIEQFIARLEDLMMLLPGLSRYFLGSAPPSETSGEAITASINASISRLATTRTETMAGEVWKYKQLVGQASEFQRYTISAGNAITMKSILKGDYAFVGTWADTNPKDEIKTKQLAMAAYRAGIISLDTTQTAFGIVSTQDEQRKIRAEKQDPIMRPDQVALSAQAKTSMLHAFVTEQGIRNPQPPQADPPKPPQISLSGVLPPALAAAIAEYVLGTAPAPGPAQAAIPATVSPSSTAAAATAAAGVAKGATDTVTGQGKPAMFENQNAPTGAADATGAGGP